MTPQPASIAEQAHDKIGTKPKWDVWPDVVAKYFREFIDWSKPVTERESQIFHFIDGSTLHYDECHHIWSWMAPAPDGMRASAVLVADQGVPAGAHPRFLALLDQMRDIHVRKARDYGELDANGHNALANMKRSLAMGISPATAAMIRMSDKWSRVQTLYARRLRDGTGPAVADESLSDTLVDLASYALLALILMEEEQQT